MANGTFYLCSVSVSTVWFSPSVVLDAPETSVCSRRSSHTGFFRHDGTHPTMQGRIDSPLLLPFYFPLGDSVLLYFDAAIWWCKRGIVCVRLVGLLVQWTVLFNVAVGVRNACSACWKRTCNWQRLVNKYADLSSSPPPTDTTSYNCAAVEWHAQPLPGWAAEHVNINWSI